MEGCNSLSLKRTNTSIQRATAHHSKYHKKMLSQQLRELEHDGIIKRTLYDEIPPKVEYSLTDEGETLREVLDLMCSWGNARIEKDPNAVNLYKEHEKKLSH